MSTSFLEKYILDDNRLQVIFDNFDDDQEEYWFYTLLNLQTKFASSDDPELDVWIKKVKDTPFADSDGVRNLLLRQAVKDFNTATVDSCRAELRNVLDVNLDHVKDDGTGNTESAAREYEHTLNMNPKKLISETFLSGARLGDVFTPAAADLLAQKKIEDNQIGELLDLISGEAPALQYLLTLIKKDMTRSGAGFGSRAIHARLTRGQMEVLLDKDDSLLNDEKFVEQYAAKLRPVSDVNMADDPAAKSTYLEALFKFAVRCKQFLNFRGTVIYNYMMDQERQGQYNRKVLKAYLAINKPSSSYQGTKDGKPCMSFDYTVPGVPEIVAVGDDEPYVKRALTRFFIDGDKATPWAKESNINDNYALPLWSETMLMEGKGNEKFQTAQVENLEKFKGKGEFKALNARVDLEISPVNKQFYSVDEAVSITLNVKNNPRIICNVYEVCAKNYYVTRRQEVPTDLNLSGSMPIVSFSKDFVDEPSLLKKSMDIEIPQLAGKRGVFIIDLIGNGVGCRACVRKGQLRFIEKQVEDGYVFKVVDEQNKEIKTGRVWCAGQDYDANGDGEIMVPFGDSTNENCMVVVEDTTQPSSATLGTFTRKAQSFSMKTGFYIDRESILAKRNAKVVIRPNLYLNEDAVSLKNIANPSVTVTTVDANDIKNTRVEAVELFDTKESMVEVLIPNNLRSILVELKGSVQGTPVINSQTFKCNSIDDSSKVADMFMYPAGSAGYVISVQGKNGEPFTDCVVDLTLSHRMFVDPIEKVVQSDHNGLIYLGRLVDVTGVMARARDPLVESKQEWQLLVDKVNVPPVICARSGDVVKIPFISTKKQGPTVLIYDSNYIENFDKNYSYKKGFIDIKNLPTGDFKVYIRDSVNADVNIHIADGPVVKNRLGEYVVGPSRIIELSEAVPLQVTSVKGTRARGYAIKVDGINDTTRLHVLMTSFIPRYTAYSLLAAPNKHPEVIDFRQVDSVYSPAASIASEYAYVMGRRGKPNELGNLMTRPSLLMGRWAPGPDPVQEEAPPAAAEAEFMDSKLVKKYPKALMEVLGADFVNLTDTSNMEFLGEPSRVYENLKPDAEGMVTIPPEWISEQNRLIQIIAVDDDNTCVRNVILEESQSEFKLTDTRLVPGLDYLKHFSEARNVVCLPLSGDTYKIEDLLTAEYEPFESLDELFYLYRAVKAGESVEAKAQIARFEPMVKWDTLSMDERLAFYDENMSNEVNYFLMRKDAEFFKTVVQPTVKSKMVKTFFDKYILGEDLMDYAQDLSKILTLNDFERIILAERTAKKLPETFNNAVLRTLREKAALVAGQPQEEDRRFLLALQSRQLSQDLMDNVAPAAPEAPAPVADDSAPAADAGVETIAGLGALGGAEEKKKVASGPVDLTKAYQERWYTDCALADSVPSLLTATPFWAEYANFLIEQGGAGAFLNKGCILATRNITEMLLALAVTDLPFSAESPIVKPVSSTDARRPLELVAKTPVIIFVKEIIESKARTSAISVSVNYFDPVNKTETIDGEDVDTFVKADEFLVRKVYGCRAVVTNVSSVAQTCEVLVQVPQNSIPVNKGFKTENYRISIPAFETWKQEFYFYFPAPGTSQVFPVHVNKNGATIGYSRETKQLTVTLKGNKAINEQSWEYIAQQATNPECLEYLSTTQFLPSLDLTPMLWRLSDPKFFDACTKVLKERQIYNDAVWAYSLVSDIGGVELGEFLGQNAQFRALAGPVFNCPLVAFDGYAERDFQYTDFDPIQNPRTGRTSDMTSTGFANQYEGFLKRVAFNSVAVRNVNMRDKMAMTVYLLIQNRVAEAKTTFKAISAKEGKTRFGETYDYLSAYLSLYDGNYKAAVKMADAYAKSMGAAKWEAIKAQAAEATKPENADRLFNEAKYAADEAAKKPSMDFTSKSHGIEIQCNNESSCMVEYWKMDLEVLFSAQPFSEAADSYTWVTPNEKQSIDKMPADGLVKQSIPGSMRNQNSIIRVTSGSGIQVTKQVYDNEIDVQTASSAGELRVLDKKGGAVSAAYVKVYSQSSDGSIAFYKDGYTDLRGRFDYKSMSTSKQMNATRYAVFVKTEKLGSSKLEITA